MYVRTDVPTPYTDRPIPTESPIPIDGYRYRTACYRHRYRHRYRRHERGRVDDAGGEHAAGEQRGQVRDARAGHDRPAAAQSALGGRRPVAEWREGGGARGDAAEAERAARARLQRRGPNLPRRIARARLLDARHGICQLAQYTACLLAHAVGFVGARRRRARGGTRPALAS